MRRAASRAAWTAGSRRATRTPMMAMTTSSSTSVKPVTGLREFSIDRRIRPPCIKRSVTAGGQAPNSRQRDAIVERDRTRGQTKSAGRVTRDWQVFWQAKGPRGRQENEQDEDYD